MEGSINDSELTPIQEFYNGTSVLVTGGSGFLGKLIIEKLLRSCTGIDILYILLRQKKGKGVQERVLELFQDPVFSRLKEEFPTYMKHVVGIAGDCALPGLGITVDDRLTLRQNVSIVFHAAANVKFNEPLKMAVTINVQGTMSVIDLCKEMPKFKSGVHVSTAYSHCYYPHIEETFYDTPIKGTDLITLLNCMSDDLADYVTKKLLGKWPNTYNFTKAITENMIAERARDLPFAILRPSIVTATCNEPFDGWIGNLYGATAFLTLFNSGVLRTAYGRRSVHLDIVPADMTVNAILAAAWDTVNLKKESMKNEVPVYNFVSYENPITIGSIVDMSRIELEKIPMKDAAWYYCEIITKSKHVFLMLHIFLHLLPAFLADCALTLMGKKPKTVKLYNFIHKSVNAFSFFMNKEWSFSNERIKNLIQNMSGSDKKLFHCDVKDIDWQSYIASYTRGIRIYVCKDPMTTVPQAKIKWRRFYWVNQCLKFVSLIIMGIFTWFVISRIMAVL